jgi:hypothetical protein
LMTTPVQSQNAVVTCHAVVSVAIM